MERANKEIEMLRKQYEAMSQELQEATQEAEVAKCRRDWAFQERDKIVAERESIRSVLLSQRSDSLPSICTPAFSQISPLLSTPSAGRCVTTYDVKGTEQLATWPMLCAIWTI